MFLVIMTVLKYIPSVVRVSSRQIILIIYTELIFMAFFENQNRNAEKSSLKEVHTTLST
jgi:hypothetical protein